MSIDFAAIDWAELRTVALVGTDRRALAPQGPSSALPDDLSAEHQALHLAALLGIAHRAGAPVQPGSPPSAPRTTADQDFAPTAAVQLLELMLSGNAGPGSMSDSLITQWYRRCAENEMVLPHRLLAQVLDGATTTRGLRKTVRPVLGQRGRWLAAQRDRWAWAAGLDHDQDPTDGPVEVDVVLAELAAVRDQRISLLRARDHQAGRELIAEACSRLDAQSRAQVLQLLETDLGPQDEDLIEAALDDRSKAVRSVAINLLERLPHSQRSDRLQRSLEPLVAKSGRLRITITVSFPDPPSEEQLRDLAPNGGGVIEQQWFDTLIGGTPLSWWEAQLGMTPEKIVGAKLKPESELIAAWTRAAIAQRNRPWALALSTKSDAAALTNLLGADAAQAAFLASIAKGYAPTKQARMLASVPGPWTAEFSSQVLEWGRKANDGKGALSRMNQMQSTAADGLHVDSAAQLTSWLDSIRTEEDKGLERVLRNLIQQLSFRTNIDQAFC